MRTSSELNLHMTLPGLESSKTPWTVLAFSFAKSGHETQPLKLLWGQSWLHYSWIRRQNGGTPRWPVLLLNSFNLCLPRWFYVIINQPLICSRCLSLTKLRFFSLFQDPEKLTIFMVKIILISYRPCLSILTWDLRYKLKHYEISQQIRTIYALGEKETSNQDAAN